MREFTFRSVVQRGTTKPATATVQTTANICNLYDTLISVINTVAGPDSKGILLI